MGHILQDWNLGEKMELLKKAYEALPKNGLIVVYDPFIDNDRSKNTAALLMSLNMLIDTVGGYNYTEKEIATWLDKIGFKKIKVEHLMGQDSIATAVK